MTARTLHPLARGYLYRLRAAAKPLPRDLREELVAEIEQHLNESLGPEPTDAEVRTVLDRLGEPAEIVLAEDPGLAAPPKRRGAHEWAAILLLPFGGVLLPFIGWFAGVILLWTSDAWTLRDKLIGTFVIPGGYLASVILLLFGVFGPVSESSCSSIQRFDSSGRPVGPVVSHCTGGGPSLLTQILGGVVYAAVLLLPLLTAIYLAHRARPRGEAAVATSG